jgi:hypothetical protein
MEISRRHFDQQEGCARLVELLEPQEAPAPTEQDIELQKTLDGMTRNQRRLFIKRMKKVRRK